MGEASGGEIRFDGAGPAGWPAEDLVQPFQLEESHYRGRAVVLSRVLDEILGAHAYPEPVARLLGETLTHAVLLAAMLRYDGIFTLQTKGSGPVPLMVCDVTGDGRVRGYAQFDADRLDALMAAACTDDGPLQAGALLGRGYLAFTVDQGPDTERYQGIVALEGDTLADCVRHYFRQSEQIVTGVKLAVERRAEGWRSGAVMLQRLPHDDHPGSAEEDDWRRLMLTLETASDAELLDRQLMPRPLLYRLFHEDGVRVFDPQPVVRACRCSRERIERVLTSLHPEDLDDMRVNGGIEVQCQFCSRSYWFDEETVDRLRRDADGAASFKG